MFDSGSFIGYRGLGLRAFLQPHGDLRVARNEKKARVFSAMATPLCQQVVKACCFNHVYIYTSINAQQDVKDRFDLQGCLQAKARQEDDGVQQATR